MGHGWHLPISNSSEYSRKACKCGNGSVITYEEVWESDWNPDRIQYSQKTTCPDNCENMEKDFLSK